MNNCQQIKTVYDKLLAKRAEIEDAAADWTSVRERTSLQKLREDAFLCLYDLDTILLEDAENYDRDLRDALDIADAVNAVRSKIMDAIQSELPEEDRLVMSFSSDGLIAFWDDFTDASNAKMMSLAHIIRHPRNRLTQMRIDDRKVSPAACLELFNALRSPFSKLSKIKLGWVNLEPENINVIAAELARPDSKLRFLSVFGYFFSDADAKKLATSLGNPACRINKLQIVSDKITDVGAQALLDAIEGNPGSDLEMLYLGQNIIISPSLKEKLRATKRAIIV